MPEFLAALLTLIGSFFQSGQPETTPPYTQEEVVTRGEQVSTFAQNLAPQEDVQTESEQSQAELPDTTRVEAYNNQSEKTIPTTVPVVAVENSPALDGVTPTPTTAQVVEVLPIDVPVETDELPDAAKDTGSAFGHEISQSNPGADHRP